MHGKTVSCARKKLILVYKLHDNTKCMLETH